MELRDLIVTPLLLIIIYALAYLIRPYVTDPINRRYFFSALTVKVIGALAIGFLYQFYYSGGDTFNYHTHGSRHIWNAIMDSPQGLNLIFGGNDLGLYKYYSRIVFYSDPASFFIVRIAALFDLITFSSYSGTAVLFAVVSFMGMWMFFKAFYEQFPHLHRWIALAAFFIPSVFFWGSGLLKDTITLASVGAMMLALKRVMIDKKFKIGSILLLLVSAYLLFSIKKYILLCFLPAALLWVYLSNLYRIPSLALRILMFPFVVAIIAGSGYWAVSKVSESDERYALSKIPETARITAYDIGYYSGRGAGSAYSLGELDGTFGNMISKAPQAINVAIFRPYLWEVRNPLMAISALECFALLLFTIYVIYLKRHVFFKMILDPNVIFCLVFSITFAFAVGISTYNFGTLSRYRIPLLPFYVMALALMFHYEKKERKFEELEVTE
jgi:hypothetical protein